MTEFNDEAGNSNASVNERLGRRQPVEFKPNFEKDVHNAMSRGMPLDHVFADQLALMNEAFPEEFKRNDIISRAPADRPMEPVKNKEQDLHNKISR